jgi:hypothetical protein
LKKTHSRLFLRESDLRPHWVPLIQDQGHDGNLSPAERMKRQ